MRYRKHRDSGGYGRFFLICLSHDSVENYYHTNFQLIHVHNYSLSEIDNLLPWEKEVYLSLIVDYEKEKREEMERAQKG